MGRIHRIFRLTPSELALLIKAGLLLWGIRLGLWLFPYERLERFLASVSDPRGEGPEARLLPSEPVVWAVRRASLLVVRATCLTQSLAVRVLLERRGFACRLFIGAGRGEYGAFSAHAWLECEGKIVIGELGAELYTPLLARKTRS